MKSDDRILGWVVGSLLIAGSLWALTLSFYGALFLLLASAFMIPPVREKIYSLNKHQLQGQTRAIFVAALCFVSLIPISNGEKREAAEKKREIHQEAAKKASEQRAQKLAAFSENPEPVLTKLREYVQKKNWKVAESTAKEYLGSKNPEILSIHALASGELKKVAEAEKAAKERRDLIKSQFSGWNGSHYALEETIKASMHNPDSYEHVETKYADMGTYLLVETKFRGTNAFGAVVTNVNRAKISLDGKVLGIVR